MPQAPWPQPLFRHRPALLVRPLPYPRRAPLFPQACLRRAVTILSRELARSFTEQGSPVPPWRTQSALLSKWQLQHSAAGCGGSLLGEWPGPAGAMGEGSPAFGRVS